MNWTARIHQTYYTKHLRLIEFVSKKERVYTALYIVFVVCFANLTNVLEIKNRNKNKYLHSIILITHNICNDTRALFKWTFDILIDDY